MFILFNIFFETSINTNIWTDVHYITNNIHILLNFEWKAVGLLVLNTKTNEIIVY